MIAVTVLQQEDYGQSLLFSTSTDITSTDKKLRSILLKAPYNIIEAHFPHLNVAYWHNPARLSSMQLTGALLSDTESLCNQTIPTDLLADVCSESLRYDRLRDLLRVCCYYFPSLEMVELGVEKLNDSPNKSTERQADSDDELLEQETQLALHTMLKLVDSLRAAVVEARARSSDGGTHIYESGNTKEEIGTTVPQSKRANPFSQPVLAVWLHGLWATGLDGASQLDELSSRIAALVPESPAVAQKNDARLLLEVRSRLTTLLAERTRRSFEERKKASLLTLPARSVSGESNTNLSEHLRLQLQAEHTWAVLCLLEAFGAAVPVLACAAALTAPSAPAVFPAAWSSKTGPQVVQALSRALATNSTARNRAYAQTQTIKSSLAQIRSRSSLPIAQTALASLNKPSDANSDTSSDNSGAYTDAEPQSPPPISITRSNTAGTAIESRAPIQGLRQAEDPSKDPAIPLQIRHTSVTEMQKQGFKAFSSPVPSMAQHPTSGYTTSQNSPEPNDAFADSDKDATPVKRSSPAPSPCSPLRSHFVKDWATHVIKLPETVGADIDILKTPTSALSTASSRSKRRNGHTSGEVSPATPALVELDRSLESRRAMELLCSASPRLPSSDHGGYKHIGAAELEPKNERSVHELPSHSMRALAALEDEDALAAARDRAAQRVRDRLRAKRLDENRAAEAALTDATIRSSHARALDRDSAMRRPWRQSAQQPSPKMLPKEESVQLSPPKQLMTSKAQQEQQERAKSVDVARRRAAQRVRAHKTRTLNAVDLQLLQSLEKDAHTPPSDIGKRPSPKAAATMISPVPWLVGSPRDVRECAASLVSTSSRVAQVPNRWVLVSPPSPPAPLSASQKFLLGDAIPTPPHSMPCTPPREDTAKLTALDTDNLLTPLREDSVFVTSPVASPDPTVSDPVYIHVLRAQHLDSADGLGVCSPYVVLHWGHLGSARTHTVSYNPNPAFHQCLQFRSPIVRNGPSAELLAALGEDTYVTWCDGSRVQVFMPLLRITVFSANSSISDEMLAEGEVDVHTMLEQSTPHVVPLVNVRGQSAGTVELQFSFKKSL